MMIIEHGIKNYETITKHNMNYSLIDFPKSRIGTFDIGRIGGAKHHVAALLEIDVTESRRRLRTLRRESGIGISFTSWLIKTISTSIIEHKEVHALLYRNKKKLLVFDEIDFATIVEKEVDGKLVPLPLVIQSTNQKTMAQIQVEISSSKNKNVQNEGDYVLSKSISAMNMKLYYVLPGMVRRLALKFILSTPVAKEINGDCHSNVYWY